MTNTKTECSRLLPVQPGAWPFAQKDKCIKYLPQTADILATLLEHLDMHSCLGGMRVPDLLYIAYQSTRN